MKPRKVETLEVVGFLVSPAGEILANQAGDLVVVVEQSRRDLFTARKRDSSLLAFD